VIAPLKVEAGIGIDRQQRYGTLFFLAGWLDINRRPHAHREQSIDYGVWLSCLRWAGHTDASVPSYREAHAIPKHPDRDLQNGALWLTVYTTYCSGAERRDTWGAH
jgi:hypothetical protein